MRITMTPVTFQPVPVVRSVPKVGPASTAAAAATRVAAKREDGGRGGRRRWGRPTPDDDRTPPHDPTTSLRATLALLDLSKALRET